MSKLTEINEKERSNTNFLGEVCRPYFYYRPEPARRIPTGDIHGFSPPKKSLHVGDGNEPSPFHNVKYSF